ncbi:integrin beta-7 isoform X1 [Coturnix japonica]|uniref:integrin beta-7 isoform X1 n=1 Tax=Coturnix japonica TaxID=93934 RepID=UPI000776BC4C|nr:integrin beta-7 isoform X1 [Coturnix japonica]
MGRGGLLLLLLLLMMMMMRAAPRGAEGSCRPQASCEECISSHPRCAWCEEPEFPGGAQMETSRCAPREALERAGCPPGAIVDPHGSLRVLRDTERGDGGGQLRPHSVEMELRAGEELSFAVRFRRARAVPVDLYFLLDLSYSMRDDLQLLQRLGTELLHALHNASSAARIGFGSFVDKPLLPFSAVTPQRSPCPAAEPCAPPAAFRHLLPLTNDSAEFQRRVRSQRVSANMDAPEGGFDAIVQVAVCQEHIGWRPVRRLLLFASDDTFHTAGDGRLGGIARPCDGRCHLDVHGEYSSSHLYDYPSVGHLAQVLSAADILPIFAVTAPVVPVYRELSRLIPGAVVGELREDSSNVVQLITDAYESLTSTVELRHSALPPGLSLSIQPHCGDPHGPPQPHSARCTGVGINQEVTFTVRVRADKCLGPPQRVGLRVVGVPEELTLLLNAPCSCPCAQRREGAALCRGGDLECGVCRCPNGRRGRRCECEGPEEAGGGCRPQNSTAPPCSGRGRCVCGSCLCPPGLSGRYCQCEEGACERHDGLPCGGEQRGQCVCGRCRCRPGFGGRGCGCPMARDGCVRDGTECSGNGRCECGRCRCQSGFVGALCERCPNCAGRCERMRDCADCAAFGRGNCSQACNGTALRVLPPPAPHGAALCRELSPDGRVLVFMVGSGDGGEDEEGADTVITVWAEEAPLRQSSLLVAVVAAAAAAGLLLVAAWGRVSVELHDRREFRRFERERLRATWDQDNPLFRSATTTTVNPNYLGADSAAGSLQ